MNIRSRRMLAACVTACWSALTLAAPGTLSLREAIALSAARNPQLEALRSEADALREQAQLQGLSPSPHIELQLENFAGTGELSGTDALESTLQFSKVIELGGKAQARRHVGDRELEKLEADQRVRRVDALAEVAARFVHVLADQERLQATQRAVTLAEAASLAAQARVEAGAASPAQASRAQIAVARARIEAEHAEHELRSSRVALATQWGDTDPAFGQVDGDLFGLVAPEPLERYVQRIENNPGILAFASEQRLIEARTRLARSQSRPSVNVNVGVRRLEAFDDAALVAGFAVPLGTSKRARGELRAVEAERAALGLREQAHRLELHSTLFGVYQELLHARTEAQALRDDIGPQARGMLATTEAGYRAGRFSFLELADAQRQLLDIELDAIDAAEAFHTLLIDLERITGQPVSALDSGESP